MNFLENPFADDVDDSVIPSDPFGDYESEQRENDFNALLVEATACEQKLRTAVETNESMLGACLQQNADARQLLDTLKEEASRTVAESVSADAAQLEERNGSASLRAVCELAMGRVLQQSADCQGAADKLRHPAQVFRERALAQLRQAPAPSVGDTNTIGHASPSQLVAYDHSGIERCLERLGAYTTSTDTISSEERILVEALLSAVHQGISEQQTAASSVTGLSRKLDEAAASLKRIRLDVTSLAGHLSRDDRLQCDANHLHTSSELSAIEAANIDLKSEIQRVEDAIARLLKDGQPLASDGVAAAFAAETQLLRMQNRLKALDAEVETLGREALYLRRAARGGSTQAETSCPESPLGSTTGATDSMIGKLMDRLRYTEEMVASLSQPMGSASIDAKSVILEQLIGEQEGCLQALATLNPFYEKQASTATLLSQLMVHDDGFDSASIQRVADVAPADPAATSEEVLAFMLSGSPATAMAGTLDAVRQKSDERVAAWRVLRDALLRFLPAEGTELELAGLGGLPAVAAPPPLRVDLTESVSQATNIELADAAIATKQAILEVSSAAKARLSEVEKKYNWFHRQSYNAPLKQLCSLHQENATLQVRLESHKGAVGEAEVLHAQAVSVSEELTLRQQAAAGLEQQATSISDHITRLRQQLA